METVKKTGAFGFAVLVAAGFIGYLALTSAFGDHRAQAPVMSDEQRQLCAMAGISADGDKMRKVVCDPKKSGEFIDAVNGRH